jgi:hypothetical protein
LGAGDNLLMFLVEVQNFKMAEKFCMDEEEEEINKKDR